MQAPGPHRHRFEFRGAAGEYFQIWIVNLGLTVLTLGLYAPWAKVRTRSYFAGNLVLDGTSFRYDADPARILIGRLIVLSVGAVYVLADLLSEPLSVALGIAFLFAYPWAAVQSTAFHRRHTLYRNIRFGFSAPYTRAFVLFMVDPILVGLSLGLAYPWWQSRRHQFLAAHSRYGATGFGFERRTGSYYRVFGRAGLAALLGLLVMGAAASLAGGVRAPAEAGLAPLVLLGLAPLVILGVTARVQAGIANLLYENARLEGVRFRSALEAWPLARLYVTSGLGIALSLGLLIPWARVRMMRYRTACLTLLAQGPLEGFVRGSEPEVGAGGFASEAADFLDFDLGL